MEQIGMSRLTKVTALYFIQVNVIVICAYGLWMLTARPDIGFLAWMAIGNAAFLVSLPYILYRHIRS